MKHCPADGDQLGDIERNLELLAQVDEVARDKGITTTQFALDWLYCLAPNDPT